MVRTENVRLLARIIGLVACLAAAAAAQDDAAYEARFLAKSPPLAEPAPAATPERYDAAYLRPAPESVANDDGSMAWGLSYRMMSLAEMYRATGESKYLDAGLELVRLVLAATDASRGLALPDGRVAPAWGCEKYTGHRAVFSVHTGMIAYAVLDLSALAGRRWSWEDHLGILFGMTRALRWHDSAWRDGPGEGEGHYVGQGEEPAIEGRPLPGNRLSAMGRALWLAGKATSHGPYAEHALAIGRYLRNRFATTPGGAWLWSYSLEPAATIQGEDVSHGALTMSLPILLASEGRVFTPEDMERLGRTVRTGFGRRDDGVLFGSVEGRADSDPALVQLPARWLGLAPFDPASATPILAFYRRFVTTPGPLDMALLIRHSIESTLPPTDRPVVDALEFDPASSRFVFRGRWPGPEAERDVLATLSLEGEPGPEFEIRVVEGRFGGSFASAGKAIPPGTWSVAIRDESGNGPSRDLVLEGAQVEADRARRLDAIARATRRVREVFEAIESATPETSARLEADRAAFRASELDPWLVSPFQTTARRVVDLHEACCVLLAGAQPRHVALARLHALGAAIAGQGGSPAGLWPPLLEIEAEEGEVEEGVYRSATSPFRIDVPDGWQVVRGQADSTTRLTLHGDLASVVVARYELPAAEGIARKIEAWEAIAGVEWPGRFLFSGGERDFDLMSLHLRRPWISGTLHPGGAGDPDALWVVLLPTPGRDAQARRIADSFHPDR